VLAARGVAARWAFVGAVPDRDREYGAALRRRIVEQGLVQQVELAGPVPYADVAAWHRRSALHVSLSPQGLFDKAVLEAMACGRPSVVAHAGYDDVLGSWAGRLRVRELAPEAVAHAVAGMLQTPAAERRRMVHELRARVLAQHGLRALAERIVGILAQEKRGDAGRIAA
jgi:glycosyltransferase involved in cell wall biosynthesis